MSSGTNHNCAPITHIYLHIPFCARICPYCAFYKERGDSSQTERFCDALLRELDERRTKLDLKLETIFIGGGTPTALTTRQLGNLLSGLRDRLDLSGLKEWTVEANPGSVSPRKAELLRSLGVSRISLGVQSWDVKLLTLLGREHDVLQAEESFRILRGTGFSNLNIDLMFGLPGQTVEQWESTLEKTIALGPEHISTYCLTYEEGTEFFARQQRGEFQEDPDSDARFLEIAMRLLERAGFEHYEISNYAREGYASSHNRGYWAGEDYLGIGPSAFSTIGFERYQNVCDYRRYSDLVLAGDSPISSSEALTVEMKRGERIALALRTGRGIPSTELTHWPNECREFEELGLLHQVDGHHVLTHRGRLLADTVAGAFV
jgi:oxygen-independent coproporphyrinogen-3 oxidase